MLDPRPPKKVGPSSKLRGCLFVQKEPKKSIERQIHLGKINYLRRISSSHADFDKKKISFVKSREFQTLHCFFKIHK